MWNVAIINKGQVILEGEIEEIRNSSKGISWEFEISSDEFLNLQDKLKITQQNKTNTGYKLRVISIHKPYQSAKQVQPTLEEIYLNLVSWKNKIYLKMNGWHLGRVPISLS